MFGFEITPKINEFEKTLKINGCEIKAFQIY